MKRVIVDEKIDVPVVDREIKSSQRTVESINSTSEKEEEVR